LYFDAMSWPVCRIVAIASSSVTRWVPSPRNAIDDFDFTTWFGLLAPAGTPQPIIDKLAKASKAALADEKVRSVLGTQAAEAVGSTPGEFRDFIRAEAAKYRRIVELTGVALK
jgi:tripartite-type tricarboxylate transporter receptor subunit TctC